MIISKYMKKRFKRNFLILFIISLFVFSFNPMIVITANAATTSSNWGKAYKKIINNYKLLDKYEDMSYLKSYFGKDYKFDKYFLCDINNNKIPELFLYSSTMGLTVVLTYSNNKVVSLYYYDICKINTKTSEIIVNGHWHGAGGSGKNEWSIYKVKNISCDIEYYIDNLFGNYSVYHADKCISTKKTTYSKILTKYVKSLNCKCFDEFKKYNLCNDQGIKNYK